MRRLLPTLAALAAALIGAAPAAADFAPIGNAAAPGPLCDLEVAGGRISVLPCRSPQWLSSADGGATWAPLGDPGYTVADLASSGSATLAYAGTPTGAAVLSLEPGAAGPIALPLTSATRYFGVAAGTPDRAGGHYVVLNANGPAVLGHADAAGTITSEVSLGSAGYAVDGLEVDAAGVVWVDLGESWLRVPPGGPATPDGLGPVRVDLGDGTRAHARGLVIGGASAPWDAFHERLSVIPGAPGLLQFGQELLRRHSDDFYSPLWYQPPRYARVTSDGATLFAIVTVQASGTGNYAAPEHLGHVFAAPLPGPAPETIGVMPASGLEMLRTANRLRADAGFPPLIGDALISRAAENHSRFWTLNARTDAVSVHSEITGRPGYTGKSVGERCAAVGTSCGGEIAYGGLAPAAAVRGWLTTPFHRGLIGDPFATVVGGAKVGDGPSIMNGRGTSAGLLLRPRPFPAGVWNGDLGFGGENPDPGEACAKLGQKLSAPYGLTVTLHAPGTVTSLQVRRVKDGRVLPGCLLGEGFVTDDAVEAATDYEATAQWTLGTTPQPAYTWRFRTRKGTAAEQRESRAATRNLDPAIRLAKRAKRAKGRWTVKLSGGQAVGRTATIRIKRASNKRVYGKTITRKLKLRATYQLKLPSRGSYGWWIRVSVPAFKNGERHFRTTKLNVVQR